jgi:hypothetical protein
MKRIYTLGLVLAFCCGFLGKTILDETGVVIVSSAHAEVAGMNSGDLRRDRDFKKAVRRIVSRYCIVDENTLVC